MNHFNNVIFGQKAFIVNDKKQLLILKRAGKEVYVDYWDVPGGKLEDGDDLFSAIAREVREETSLKLIRIILTLSSSKFTGNQLADKPIIFRNIYLCQAEGEVKLSEEHSEFKWVELSELEKYKFPEDEDFQWVITNLAKSLAELDPSKSYSHLA